MSLANLEKTLLLCIEYNQKAGNDDKVAKLKDHLKKARENNLSSNESVFPPIITIES